jgi:Tfp pilus assembly protein PilW
MKKYLTLKTQKGASLVEILVYFALLSIVLLIATDLMLKSGEFGLEFSSKNNIQADGKFISNRLVNNIHQATNITTPANLGDSDSTLVLMIGNETHTYTLIGTDLQYTKETPPPGATTKTANINSNLTKINSISFQRLGNTGGKNMIKITFEIEDVKGKKGNPIIKTFETMVGIR